MDSSDTWLVWIVAALFYAPIHILPPILITALYSPEPAQRRQRIRHVLIDCLLTMLVAFAIALWQWQAHLLLVMSLLFFALLPPYIRVLSYRRQQ